MRAVEGDYFDTCERREAPYLGQAVAEAKRAVYWYDKAQELEIKLAEVEKALQIERTRVGVLRKPLQKIIDNPCMSSMCAWEMAEKALKATEQKEQRRTPFKHKPGCPRGELIAHNEKLPPMQKRVGIHPCICVATKFDVDQKGN